MSGLSKGFIYLPKLAFYNLWRMAESRDPSYIGINSNSQYRRDNGLYHLPKASWLTQDGSLSRNESVEAIDHVYIPSFIFQKNKSLETLGLDETTLLSESQLYNPFQGSNMDQVQGALMHQQFYLPVRLISLIKLMLVGIQHQKSLLNHSILQSEE